MSADERNDTIALLSLATYPYPGEKSKKHKEIQIMKRYLSLALALILALSVVCGVSVSAEEDVDLHAACQHPAWITQLGQSSSEQIDACKTVVWTYDSYICAKCGYERRENETITATKYHHDYVLVSFTDYPNYTMYGYSCKNCGETKSDIQYK